MKQWKKFGLSLIGLMMVNIVYLGWMSPAFSVETPNPPGKVVMVTIDDLDWDLVLENQGNLPTFRRLMQEGSVGLLNTKTAGVLAAPNTYLTIGGGSRLNGGDYANRGFNAFEMVDGGKAKELYRRRTGETVSDQAIVQPRIAQILEANADLRYPAKPGALGDELHQAGYKTAVIGNGDISSTQIFRPGVDIAMDSTGKVDIGRVDSWTNHRDDEALGGISTDYQKVLQECQQVLPKAQLIVVDLGDLSRIDAQVNLALDQVLAKQRRAALLKIDEFMAEVSQQMDFTQDMLIVVTPTPTRANLQSKKWFTPIIIKGPEFSAGLLTSATTKRAGIVTNTDIAPTVLHFFNLDKGSFMTGQVISPSNQAGGVAYLQQLAREANFTYLARPILVQGYVSLQIIVLIIAIISVFWRKPKPKLIKPVLLGLMLIPLVLLLLPLTGIQSIPLAVLVSLVLAALGVMVILGITHGELEPFIIICLLTSVGILTDVLIGSPLIKQSVLGYDAMEGARFYGIGNEFMGVIIGASIIGTTALLENYHGWRRFMLLLTGGFYSVVIYVMAAPNLGTNVGGTIAAIAGLGITFMLLLGIRPSKFSVGAVALLVFLVVIGFISFDLQRPAAEQSHIGRTANMLIKGGWQTGLSEAGDIILRKLDVNLRLIRYTKWSRVFLTSIVALAILFYRPIGVMKEITSKYRWLTIGFIGVIVGSFVALIFNDSGIVAAATMMIFGSAPLIYLVMHEIDHQKLN